LFSSLLLIIKTYFFDVSPDFSALVCYKSNDFFSQTYYSTCYDVCYDVCSDVQSLTSLLFYNKSQTLAIVLLSDQIYLNENLLISVLIHFLLKPFKFLIQYSSKILIILKNYCERSFEVFYWKYQKRKKDKQNVFTKQTLVESDYIEAMMLSKDSIISV